MGQGCELEGLTKELVCYTNMYAPRYATLLRHATSIRANARARTHAHARTHTHTHTLYSSAEEWKNVALFLRQLYSVGDDMAFMSKGFDTKKKGEAQALIKRWGARGLVRVGQGWREGYG